MSRKERERGRPVDLRTSFVLVRRQSAAELRAGERCRACRAVREHFLESAIGRPHAPAEPVKRDHDRRC